jgi:pilus assembly protein CpaD
MYRKNFQNVPGRKWAPATTCLVAIALTATSLGGCRNGYEGRQLGFEDEVHTYQELHPIGIEKKSAELSIAALPGAEGLNIYQKEQIRHFIGLWRNEGHGKLLVSASNAALGADLRDILVEHRTAAIAVEAAPYHGNQPGVKLSFIRYGAVPPECGIWPEDVGRKTESNANYYNFGCADQHNLAAMIAEPHDLIAPRETTDWADGDRRDKIFQQYWIGGETAADTSKTTKGGQVSDVVKGQ